MIDTTVTSTTWQMVELELEHLRQGKEQLGAVIEHMRSTNKKLEDDLRQVCQCVSVCTLLHDAKVDYSTVTRSKVVVTE
jgi:hypothetical protein